MLLHRGAPDHERVAGGVPGRFRVEGRVGGQRGSGAARRRDGLEVSAGAGPGDVGDGAPVGGPRGHELVLVGVGEAGGGPVRHVHPVEAAERREDDGAAVRGQARPADDAGGDRGAVVHAPGEIEPGRDLGLHLRLEGDGGHGAGLEVNPPESPVHRGDQSRPVRGEGVAGHRVAAGAGLLIVAGDPVREPAFLAGGEVADAKRRPGAVAGRVHEMAAVGVEQRAHRASGRAGDGGLLAGLAVKADHLPDGELRVVVEGPAPFGEIDVAAVGGGDRAEPVGRLRARNSRSGLGRLVAEPDPGSAVAVDQEDRGGALRRA